MLLGFIVENMIECMYVVRWTVGGIWIYLCTHRELPSPSTMLVATGLEGLMVGVVEKLGMDKPYINFT
jgi:hypothetical protein